MLELKDLRVDVGEREVVAGVSLQVNRGEIHALLGPNGAGKSTLCHAIIGHPSYKISGTIKFEGRELNGTPTNERAKMGIFLGFQNPIEIEGLELARFLRDAHNLQRPAIEGGKFRQMLKREMGALGLDESFMTRSVNFGFSGGEKKKAEVLQMIALKPKLAIMDEPDSGLDVDSVRLVASKIESAARDGAGVLLVTHLALLKHIRPDKVHVMIDGRIVESGGAELVEKIERYGFEIWRSENGG